ncbi:MAG TPA: hypothetical protein VIF62_05795, partial [Labilithrix sp.]
AFVFRLATGLASWGALALFVKTTLPWLATERDKLLHLRVATLLGFLPYLFVRTSSETLSMATFTAAWAIVLAGAEPGWRVTPSLGRLAFAGVLIGVAFEARFQSAILAVGLAAWLFVVARVRLRLVALVVPALAVVALSLFVDRWGYGVWTFPPWTYVQANLLEGAASLFGADPPFAYLWASPANLFAPIVIVLLVLAVLAWLRNPRHPVTWTTLPFFVVHNLLSHKEERFLFPMAILATAFVTMALGSSPEKPRAERFASWLRRRTVTARVLAVWSTAFMLFLAFWPLGWHHHIRFMKHVHDAVGADFRAMALLDYDLGLPAFHGRVYDIKKGSPEDIARAIEDGTARTWLVVDTPRLHTGVPGLDDHATLVWSELPLWDRPEGNTILALTDAYDAHAKPPLRPIRYRSLYRLEK